MDIIYLMLAIVLHDMCLCYEANGSQEVRLSKPAHRIRVVDTKKEFSVLYSKPLHIIFEGVDATSVRCRVNQPMVAKSATSIRSNGTTTLTINAREVTSDLSGQWHCTLTVNENSYTTYLFNIRVKAANKISVTVGATKSVFTDSNDLEVEYDGSTEYSCEEWEIIELTCSNMYKDGSIRLRYYDMNGTEKIKTDEIQFKKEQPDYPLNFRLLVRAETHRSYVDCTYISIDRQEFTYRITFKVTNNARRNNDFIVTVNDTRLIPMSHQVNGSDIYNYKFIYGASLLVTCELKDKTILSDIIVKIVTPTNISIDTRDVKRTQTVYQFLVDTIYLEGRIECFTYSDNRTFYNASINLDIDRYGNLAILGLPASDVLYQYSKNRHKWVAHYQYTPHTTLLLTCMSSTDSTLQWLHGKNKTEGNKVKTSLRTVVFWSINGIFTLDQRSIACVAADKPRSSSFVLELKFHQKFPLVMESDSGSITSPTSTLNSSEDNDSPGTQSHMGVIIGCVAGVLLAVVAAAACTYYWRKEHKNAVNIEKKPYNNFCEDVNPIPEVSRQLENDEYIYITNEYSYNQNEDGVMVTNCIYYRSRQDNMATSKKNTASSNPTEIHYAEIDDTHKGTTSNNTYQNTSVVSCNNLQNENCNNVYCNFQKDTGYENIAATKIINNSPNSQRSNKYSPTNLSVN